MKQVELINEQGFWIETIFITDSDELSDSMIEIRVPTDIRGFHRPKWDGQKWVEDMSQEEIDELNNQPREFTQEDYILDIDFRLSMIELGL